MNSSSRSLRDLFEAALALPASARAEFLDTHCPPDMRAHLERMLSADEDVSEPVSDKELDRLARAIGDGGGQPVLPAGSRVGPFELVRVIGEGGSSTVFHATRTFEDATQHVALKLLRQSLHSPESQRRFGREQRALIQLRHPNIARMIEGGVTDTGLPYIALELVSGTTITEHASEHRLDLRQRLRLFVLVCKAVDAAHRALIVHRDLKPSNVLVTDEGEVKLLDFGVAKLLAEEEDEGKRTLLPAFTPAYAAPEQRSGGAITTATDVYALGVLLGELVTGQRVNDGSGRTPSSQISDSTEPGVLPASAPITRRQVRGDLDAIVLKAVDVDPTLRYASAGVLADDIERLLAGQPVSAHAPTGWYRVSKFVTRHKGGVATTVAFLIAIFASLGIAVVQADIARQEARRANAVKAFLESMFEPIRNGIAIGKQPSLAKLVGDGATRIDETPSLGSAERVELLLMFAKLQDYLGEYVQFQMLADRAGALADADLGVRDGRSRDALVLRGVAALRRSDLAMAGRHLTAAEQRYEQTDERDEAWLRLLAALSQWAGDTGDPQLSLGYVRRALEARIERFGADSVDTAGGYSNFAYGLVGVGQFAEAAEQYRRAYAIFVDNYGADSERSVHARAGLALAELMQGRVRKAREELRATVDALGEPQGKPSAGQIGYTQWLCLTEAVADAAADNDAMCTRAVDYAERSEGPDGTDMGRALHVQGVMLLEQGQLAAARLSLQRSRDILAAAGRTNWQARAEVALGEIELLEGHPPQARDVLASALSHLGTSYPPYLRGQASALLELACLRDVQENLCTNAPSGSGAAALAAQPAPWNPLLLPANIALARIDLHHRRATQALARLDDAVAVAAAEIAAGGVRMIDAQLWRAVATGEAGDCAAARLMGVSVRTGIEIHAKHALLRSSIEAARNTPTCGDLLR